MLSEEEKEMIRVISASAAEDAVRRTLMAFGFKVQEQTEVQQDMAYLRKLRDGSSKASDAIRKSAITIFVSTVAWLLWEGIKHMNLKG